jgi:hypothetical protein
MTTTVKSKFALIIDGSANPSIIFKPSKEFYESTGIKRKRFGQIYRGEKSPMMEEVENACKYLDIPLQNIFPSANA